MKILMPWLMLWLVVPGLWCLGYRRVVRVLERWGRIRPIVTKRSESLSVDHARRLAQSVAGAAAWHPLRPTCLPRAVTLWWLMRQRGIQGEIRFGARHVQKQFEAHAWVECQGRVLNDSPAGPEF